LEEGKMGVEGEVVGEADADGGRVEGKVDGVTVTDTDADTCRSSVSVAVTSRIVASDMGRSSRVMRTDSRICAPSCGDD
jgi:hypothetical protein